MLKGVKTLHSLSGEELGEYRTNLVRYLLGRGASPEQAEDLAQDTFAKVIDLYGLNKVHSGFRTLLRATATNLWIDSLRKSRRQTSLIERRLIPSELVDSNVGPENVAKEQIKSRVNDALKYLTDKQLEVVRLFYFEGQGETEIAEIVELEKGSIRAHLFRSRECLRKHLQVYD